jgi:site-specific recombinase XerD
VSASIFDYIIRVAFRTVHSSCVERLFLILALLCITTEIITKQTIVEYLNSLSHLKYTTHHKHQAILQSLLNFAVEQGYIKFNPIRGLKQRSCDQEKGEHRSC